MASNFARPYDSIVVLLDKAVAYVLREDTYSSGTLVSGKTNPNPKANG